MFAQGVAGPSIKIRSEDYRALDAYAAISIAFEVEEILSHPTLGMSASQLRGRLVAQPYLKDYDALPHNHPSEWPTCFDVQRALFLAAYVNERRVGGAVVVVDPADATRLGGGEASFGLLWDLRVGLDERRRGIGRALLAAAESCARSARTRGLVAETQDVNVAACRLYANAGYELTRIVRAAYPAMLDEVQLVWSKSFV